MKQRDCKSYPEYIIKEIEAELIKVTDQKTITCAQATSLAAALKIEPLAVGIAANRLGLKITKCQLGCFGQFKE